MKRYLRATLETAGIVIGALGGICGIIYLLLLILPPISIGILGGLFALTSFAFAIHVRAKMFD